MLVWEFGLDVALVGATNRWNIIVESGSADNDVWVLVLVDFVGGLHGGGVSFVVCIGTEAGVLSVILGSCTFASLHLALRPSMVTDAVLSTYAVSSSILGGLAQPGV